MLVAGLWLAGPSLITSLRYRAVDGEILDAFPQPLDEARVRLAVVYEYPIHAGDLASRPGPARGLGHTRSDRFGRVQPDLILGDAAAADFLASIHQRRHRCRVYYRPGAPTTTARALIAPADDSLLFSLPHLGMILILTPLVSWFGTALLGINRERTRPAPRR